MSKKSCEFCGGTGGNPCDLCNGETMITEPVNSRARWFVVSRTTSCHRCKGRGRIICYACNGTGIKSK